MESVIIKPSNELLKKYVQYFLFFKKTDHNFLNYATFPNNNLCLAIYKENDISYIKDTSVNNCVITSDSKAFCSRLFGFHKMPFNVDIHAVLDQVCILFYPAALSAFTKEPYADLMDAENVIDIFKPDNDFVLEQIFEENNFAKRALKIEQLLLKKLNDQLPSKLKEALYIIDKDFDNTLSIESLAKKLDISTPSLFRLFKNNVGLNPKSYIKTIRFRNILTEILNTQQSLTDIAYANRYYDQAHFIHDFKSFTGHSPNQLINKISIEQNDLAWIYNKKSS